MRCLGISGSAILTNRLLAIKILQFQNGFNKVAVELRVVQPPSQRLLRAHLQTTKDVSYPFAKFFKELPLFANKTNAHKIKVVL